MSENDFWSQKYDLVRDLNIDPLTIPYMGYDDVFRFWQKAKTDVKMING